MMPLILYVAVAMITGIPNNWTFKPKGAYYGIFILLFTSLFFFDVLDDMGVAIITMMCGIFVILLSTWHIKISIQDEWME